MQLTPKDIIIELLAAIGLALTLGVAAWYYGHLPETIPTHFGPNGQPDGFSQKSRIFMLPALGLAIYIAMTLISRAPHKFNYPVTITPENKEMYYRRAAGLVRFLKAFIMLLFAYIVWSTVQIALGHAEGLGWWLAVLVPLITMGSMFYFTTRK
ncbi:MAG: DUF1648 domain-containing protein [Saprospiraceae bacterium]|nr:DUF1648 domain-containing protein [Saprospiraceae bacterium]